MNLSFSGPTATLRLFRLLRKSLFRLPTPWVFWWMHYFCVVILFFRATSCIAKETACCEKSPQGQDKETLLFLNCDISKCPQRSNRAAALLGTYALANTQSCLFLCLLFCCCSVILLDFHKFQVLHSVLFFIWSISMLMTCLVFKGRQKNWEVFLMEKIALTSSVEKCMKIRES